MTEEKKKEFRRYFLANRAQIPEKTRAARDKKIRDLLISSPLYKNSKTIFTYLSVDDEIDTRKFIGYALEDGKKVYIPKISGKSLMLPVRIKSFNDLRPGDFGIPTSKLSETCEKPDLVIVPGLCFDKDFYRIGYGGGFYDSYLKQNQAPSLGLFYSSSEIKKVPKNEFDISLNYVLTEEGFR